MTASSVRQSVRAHVARQTRAAHLALHSHDWIARLTSPQLTLADYGALLQAYLWFHQHVEARRRGACAFEALSLDRGIAALRTDLRALGRRPDGSGPAPDLALQGPTSILAALYVLHGARFGATRIEPAIAAALPQAPRHYVSARLPAPLWHALVAELEAHGKSRGGRARLVGVARQTFVAFGGFVTACCEAAAGAEAECGATPRLHPPDRPSPGAMVLPDVIGPLGAAAIPVPGASGPVSAPERG